MADMWIQGSFAFRCTPAERALIEEAVNAGHDLCAGVDGEPPGPELLAAFPPTDLADPWSGFRDAFADPDFPTVGADFAGERSADETHHPSIRKLRLRNAPIGTSLDKTQDRSCKISECRCMEMRRNTSSWPGLSE